MHGVHRLADAGGGAGFVEGVQELGGGGQWTWVDARDAEVRARWTEAADERRRAFEAVTREARTERLEVPLDEDLAAPILRFFRLRAARAGRKGQ